MKIGYVSDIHLEFQDYPSFNGTNPNLSSYVEGGDVLLLAGDILTANLLRPGRTDSEARSLRKYLLKHFKPHLLDKFSEVYMVLGNHEHYRSIFKYTRPIIQEAFKELGLNIKILDNDRVFLNDDTILIGCTLWSDYLRGNPLAMQQCEYGMNDYRLIGSLDVDDMNYYNKNQPVTVTPEFLLNEFNRSLAYIQEILNDHPDKDFVVMTHHGMSYKMLNNEHMGNGLDGAYASDLSDFILDNPSIKYIVSGHSHVITEFEIGTTKLLANCRGYAGESSYRKFGGIKYFEV